MLTLLVTQSEAQNLPQTILWTLLILVGLIVGLVLAVVIGHRVLVKKADSGHDSQPFTLADLRRMHRQGQITDAEFAQTKAVILAHSRAAMNQSVTHHSTTQDRRPNTHPSDSDKDP